MARIEQYTTRHYQALRPTPIGLQREDRWRSYRVRVLLMATAGFPSRPQQIFEGHRLRAEKFDVEPTAAGVARSCDEQYSPTSHIASSRFSHTNQLEEDKCTR